MALKDAVNARGVTFITHTRLHGRTLLRFVGGNPNLTRAELRACWDAIVSAAGVLRTER
jgi:hypothetical protein